MFTAASASGRENGGRRGESGVCCPAGPVGGLTEPNISPEKQFFNQGEKGEAIRVESEVSSLSVLPSYSIRDRYAEKIAVELERLWEELNQDLYYYCLYKSRLTTSTWTFL